MIIASLLFFDVYCTILPKGYRVERTFCYCFNRIFVYTLSGAGAHTSTRLKSLIPLNNYWTCIAKNRPIAIWDKLVHNVHPPDRCKYTRKKTANLSLDTDADIMADVWVAGAQTLFSLADSDYKC